MPALLAGLGSSVLAGIKANPVTYLVKLARGLFTGSLGSIGFLWYTGWRRERVAAGSGQFPFPGLSKLAKQFDPSLPDESFPENISGVGSKANKQANTNKNALDPALTPPGQVAPGQATKSKHESFDPLRYQARYHTAQRIANQFNARITSAHRTPAHNAQVGGVPESLHIDGLAFDFVASVSDMSRLLRFGQDHPELFSEVLLHNVGSGYHVHLAFWPGAGL
jgi:hypothetical protein